MALVSATLPFFQAGLLAANGAASGARFAARQVGCTAVGAEAACLRRIAARQPRVAAVGIQLLRRLGGDGRAAGLRFGAARLLGDAAVAGEAAFLRRVAAVGAGGTARDLSDSDQAAFLRRIAAFSARRTARASDGRSGSHARDGAQGQHHYRRDFLKHDFDPLSLAFYDWKYERRRSPAEVHPRRSSDRFDLSKAKRNGEHATADRRNRSNDPGLP